MDFYWNIIQSWLYGSFNSVPLLSFFSTSSSVLTDTSAATFSLNSTGNVSPRSMFQHRHFNSADGNCPVCLNPFLLPVETNCGHMFCAQCIVVYWQQSQWRGGPIKCPVCRQQVNILLQCYNVNNIAANAAGGGGGTNPSNSSTQPALDDISSSDNSQEQTNNGSTTPSANGIGAAANMQETARNLTAELNRYNRRFSGQPRPWYDYLYDLPTMLRHLSQDFFSFDGLFYMFRIRVVICIIAAIMYLISPLDMIPEAVFGIFGLIDDIVVVLLLAIYVTIIYRNFLSSRWGDD